MAKPIKCFDHLGNEYRSKNEMAKAYGKDHILLHNRLRRNWTLEQALTTPRGVKLNTGKERYDHLGNKHRSLEDMAKAYNKDTRALGYRLNNGWSLEDALTKDYNDEEYVGRGVECKDHLGNSYKSVTEMCRTYGIDVAAYYGRRKNKWSLKKSLITPVGGHKPKDHLGNEYENIGEMCKAYGIAKDIFISRIKRKWGIERALTEVVISSKKKCVDHKGIEYKSVSAMCKAYGVNIDMYDRRIKLGWSIEKALSLDKVEREKSCEDIFGNRYESIEEMLNIYGIDRSCYYTRIRQDWDMGEALGIDGRGLRRRVGTTFKGLTFEKFLYTGRNKLDYYLCSSMITGKEIILNEKNWIDYVEIMEK